MNATRGMNNSGRYRGLWLVLMVCAGVGLFAGASSAAVTAIKAGTVHVGDGRTLENGVVLIEDGRITAVGTDVSIPDGATIIEMPRGHVSPGLIDANARVESRDLVPTEPRRGRWLAPLLACKTHTGEVACSCSGLILCRLADMHSQLDEDQICPVCGFPAPPGLHDLISGVRQNAAASPTEATAEVVPHTMMIDSVNLRSPDFTRLARGGVTTVYAAADNAAVIGPRGAVVHTAGSFRERIMLEAADVQAAMGTDTFRIGGGNAPPFRNFVSYRTRRPGSRMGVAWVFRKAFYDARNAALGHEIGGADTPPEPAIQVLQDVLDGDIPLRIAARSQKDIEGAIRLTEEFGLEFTLLEGTEAHTAIDKLRETETPVIFGPIMMERTGFGSEPQARLTTFHDLVEAGIPTALSARDLREEDGLARQAMYARRSGVELGDVMRAVTQVPAGLLGIEETHGTVESGKHADLVIWSGEPFTSTTRPEIVMIKGRIVIDHRSDT